MADFAGLTPEDLLERCAMGREPPGTSAAAGFPFAAQSFLCTGSLPRLSPLSRPDRSRFHLYVHSSPAVLRGCYCWRHLTGHGAASTGALRPPPLVVAQVTPAAAQSSAGGPAHRGRAGLALRRRRRPPPGARGQQRPVRRPKWRRRRRGVGRTVDGQAGSEGLALWGADTLAHRCCVRVCSAGFLTYSFVSYSCLPIRVRSWIVTA